MNNGIMYANLEQYALPVTHETVLTLQESSISFMPSPTWFLDTSRPDSCRSIPQVADLKDSIPQNPGQVNFSYVTS
jgi:hypothetical protein